MDDSHRSNGQKRNLINFCIWLSQFSVGLPFIGIALMKMSFSMPELGQAVPWAAQYPVMVRIMGAIDLVGGLGILLPSLTRIWPRLTVWAAIGCSLLMVCAAVFHVSRGEASATPLNAIFLALSLFVWWGRSRAVPIKARYLAK